MASLAELESTLADVSGELDGAAKQIRDLDLKPSENIRRVGEAIVLLAEIREDIYECRPDLAPAHLKKR